MSICSFDKKNDKKQINKGKHKSIFESTWFFLLSSFLFMTLPQLIFFLVSKIYQYDYGIKNGRSYLIIGIFLWLDTYVGSCIDKIFEGISLCGFIFGIMLMGLTAHNFFMLYQYVQTMH